MQKNLTNPSEIEFALLIKRVDAKKESKMKKLIDYKIETFGPVVVLHIKSVDKSQDKDGLIFDAKAGLHIASDYTVYEQTNDFLCIGEDPSLSKRLHILYFLNDEDADKYKDRAIASLAEWEQNGGFNECKPKPKPTSISEMHDDDINFVYLIDSTAGEVREVKNNQARSYVLHADRLGLAFLDLTEAENHLKKLEDDRKAKQETTDPDPINECQEDPKQVGRFIPKIGERYYVPKMTGGSFGSVVSVVHSGNYQDICDINTGRCYRTAKEAFDVFMRQKAIVRVNDAIDRMNDGWVPDWDCESENKHGICYNHDEGKIKYWTNSFIQRNDTINYCKTKKIIDQIIKDHQDDLKLILGVNDDN